jgi:hypothetical protein
MSPSEREAYERECLLEIQKVQKSWAKRTDLIPNQIRSARLEGEYPETAVVVRWLDSRDKQEHEKSYYIWISPITMKPSELHEQPEGRDLPYTVALITTTNVMES